MTATSLSAAVTVAIFLMPVPAVLQTAKGKWTTTESGDREDLGLTEGEVRGAIRTLEAIGFLFGDP